MISNALPQAWQGLRYHPKQAAAWQSTARYVALPCGRGSGKTMLARRRIVRFLPVRKPWHDPLYAYILPTYNQAKRVAWKPLLELIPPSWIKKKNETDLTLETVFGSTLIVAGADQPQRLEGVQYDGVVIDESSDQKPGIFERTFLPSFAHRKAWCWRIGVPKRQGAGAAEYKRFCESAHNVGGSDTDVECYSWPSADIVDNAEIEAAKRRLDPRDYAEQYEANWQNATGGIFYAFADDNIAQDDSGFDYSPAHTIVVGSDFNVDPMCWILAHRIGDWLLVFDELFLRNTNTQNTLNHLHSRYSEHKSGFMFIGDASGKARKSSASASDYIHIINDKRFQPKQVFYPKSNPPVADRFAATNALICNAAGDIRLIVHPRCKHLIADLYARSYKEGSKEPNDSGDIGHMTDALGYVVYAFWPPMLQRDNKQAQIGVVNNG